MILAFGAGERGFDIVDRGERWAAVERRGAEPRPRHLLPVAFLRQAETDKAIDVVAKRAASLAASRVSWDATSGSNSIVVRTHRSMVRRCASARREDPRALTGAAPTVAGATFGACRPGVRG
ncbi:MAG TPA: hypothetical protein VGO80_11355 [Solirubrobacteraceae bacterium]|nr:hypothetical protein [Solirubrobacteraceae bacterium]